MELSQLRPLVALLEERHVSRAAERMNITQPAMSRILERLRQDLGDDLLVRQGRNYERTPRGETLLADGRALIERFDELISNKSFNPGENDSVFRIATTDYASAVFVPALLVSLRAAAPRAAIALSMADRFTGQNVASGRIDFAIAGRNGSTPGQLRREELFSDDYVCVVRATEKKSRGRLTLREYTKMRHVAVDVVAGGQPPIERPLEALGLRRDVALRTPFLSSAVFALLSTDLVLTIPRRLADRVVTNSRLRLLQAPAEIEKFRYDLVWHSRIETSRAHAWFLDRMRDVAAGLSDPQ